jgi:hypothetical protein
MYMYIYMFTTDEFHFIAYFIHQCIARSGHYFDDIHVDVSKFWDARCRSSVGLDIRDYLPTLQSRLQHHEHLHKLRVYQLV